MFAVLRSKRAIGGSLLVFALVAAYSNHFQNSFHFDDAHTIENNAAIRELKNIPRFFYDATTFSSLPSNQSYRPLVSTLLTIDYRLGASPARTGGLNPLPFHLSIFALFVALVFFVAFVIKRLLAEQTASRQNSLIALGAAALYGLHPANADTVNYVIASAEIMSALGIIGSFAIYFWFPRLRGRYIYVLPAVLAILAKPTSAIFPVLFATFLFLFSESPLRRRLLEIGVPFVICALTLFFVQHMTPRSWVSGARSTHNYLITQPYVALLYFKTFFWPNNLSADYDLDPLTTTDDPRFWAGFVFVVLLITMSILAARFRSTRVIGFGLLWFLICLLPTSLFPLAEAMNDHRTFLPYVGLVIVCAGAASLLLRTEIAQRVWIKAAFAGVILLVMCGSGYAAFQRNNVWKNEETLWRDVTIKSQKNPRGLMNYGNTLMAKGQYKQALDYFHRALTLAPQYAVLFVNLAVAEDAIGQTALAEEHFKEAMRLAPGSPDSYSFYGRYLLAHEQADEARTLFQTALSLSPTDMTAREFLAQANDQATNPSPPETPESYLALGLARYQEGRYSETIAACQQALRLRPSYAEAWNNICAAYNKLGRFQEGADACEQALRNKPDFDLARNNLNYAREMMKASSK